MANQKKKKKKTNIDDIIQQMELDMMRAGKIPGEEGTSLVTQMQLRRRLESMPQSGAVTALVPLNPLDLAFETVATGLAHAEGVDPRLAILGSMAAARYGPRVATAVNIKGGGYLSRRAYKKGMESASKDPMFSDIDYPREVQFVGVKDPTMGAASGWYQPSAGLSKRHLELYPNQRKFPGEEGWVPPEKSIFLRERTLGGILTGGKTWGKDWGESIVRHESRHYKQHVEGMKRKEELGDYGGWKGLRQVESKYGYPADWGTSYSTLIKIPKPKNLWPGIEKKYIDKKTGRPMKPSKVRDIVAKEHGKLYAATYTKWYKKRYEEDVLSQWDVTSGKEYFQRPIEVEARIEEISSLGENSGWAFDDLVKRAGYTKKQVSDMVAEYRVAKKKYKKRKYKAEAQEFRKR